MDSAEGDPGGILTRGELVVPCSSGSSLPGIIFSEDLKHFDLWAYLLLLPP